MKIAIPVEHNQMDGMVGNSFGRVPWYLIVDKDSGESLYIENLAAQSQGGAGIKAAQQVVDSGAEVLITPRCGENAAKVLKEAGIRLYQAKPGTIRENLQAMEDGSLELLSEIHAGFHGHGE